MEIPVSFCPLNLIVRVIGDKWTLLILRGLMFENKRHFRQFLQSEENIASNILTNRLNLLGKEGLITRRPDPDHKQKIIYSLTQKGIDLMPILVEVIRWSLRYDPVDLVKYKSAVDMIEGGITVQKEMKKELIRKHLAAEQV